MVFPLMFDVFLLKGWMDFSLKGLDQTFDSGTSRIGGGGGSNDKEMVCPWGVSFFLYKERGTQPSSPFRSQVPQTSVTQSL